MARFDEDVQIIGNLTVNGGTSLNLARANLVPTSGEPYPLFPFDFRVWDAFQTVLPSPAAADDLGITTGTWGTANPYLTSRDLNALGATTGYARTLFQLPPEYVSSGACSVRFAAGMLTAVASVSATVDVEIFKMNRDTLVSGSDLVSTAAQSINSLTFANYSFTVTPTSLAPGDLLDIRVAIAANSATGSSHFAVIAASELLLTVKG